MSVAVTITYARITSEVNASGDLKAQLGAFAGGPNRVEPIHGKPLPRAGGDPTTTTMTDRLVARPDLSPDAA